MNYTKPEVIAKNQPTGSFAAGCPARDRYHDGGNYDCKSCDRTE